MPFPVLGDALPQRGYDLTRAFWKTVVRLIGWDMEGELPNRAKLVVIGAPHTSNWDFFLAMAMMLAMGLDVRWMGKHTIFRWPLRSFLQWLGGIPIDRSRRHGTVEQLTQTFKNRKSLIVGLAPEGSRKRVDRWKTGFYHIALAAGVPIVPAYLDYHRKQVGFGDPLTPTGDVDADIKALQAFYEPYQRAGKRPELY